MSDRVGAPTEPARVVVVGVGNRFRGDDGIGHLVVDLLAADDEKARAASRHPCRPPSGRVELVYSDGEPSRLLDAWEGADLAIVVDAVVTGGEPGRVVVREAGRAELPARSAMSSHASGLGEAWALGRALGRLPERLLLVGVEIGSVHDGEGLTDAVAAALPAAHRVVRAAIATAPETPGRSIAPPSHPTSPSPEEHHP